MNWFLLLLILKLFTTNWSAPIDLVETKDEFLQDKENLDNLITKGFSVADDANNLLKTTENLVNQTVNTFNSSTLNESLSENFNKIKEDLLNFSSEVQKDLEHKPIERSDVENKAQVIEIKSFDVKSPKEALNNEEVLVSQQNPVENVTEKQEEVLENINNSGIDIESRSNTLISSDSVDSTQNLNSETLNSNGAIVQENLNLNHKNLHNQSENHFNLEKPEENTETLNSNSETVQDNQSENLFNQEKLKENSDAETTANIPQSSSDNTLQETLAGTLISNAETVQENFSANYENLHNQWENLFNQEKQEENTNDEPTGNIQETTSDNTLQEVQVQDTLSSSTTQENTSSPDLPALKETVGNLAEELKNMASIVQPSTESSSVEVGTIFRNVDISETDETSEKHEVKTPTFREAVDSFIDDVVEIGSKLGFVEEQKPKELNETEQVSENIEKVEENPTEQPPQVFEYSLVNLPNIHEENTEIPKASVNNEVSLSIEHSTEQPIEISVNSQDIFSGKTPTFGEAVDSFINDVVEIGSKLGFGSEQPTDIKQSSEVTEISTNPSSPLENSTELPSEILENSSGVHQENSEHSPEQAIQISGNSQDISSSINQENTELPLASVSTEEPQHMESSTSYQIESSSETPALKQTVDSLINQVAEIGSNLGNTAKEIINDASMSSNIPVIISYENSTESQDPNAPAPEDHNEKVPTFKDAVDAFIEDVSEIGSKLGLIPEEKTSEEQVSVNTESENETVNFEEHEAKGNDGLESTATSENNSAASNSPIDSFVGKLDEIVNNLDSKKIESQSNEYITTTPPSLDEDKSVLKENIETTIFGRSPETLIEAASEIGNNFGQAVSNLFSLSENKPESVTEVANESSTENLTSEDITTTPATLEKSNFELQQNSETNNFDKSSESIIEAASEIGNNFGQTVSNLFSLSENNQESLTEIPIESSTETLIQKEENNSENLQITSEVSFNENIQADTQKLETENFETSSTTQDSNENVAKSEEDLAKSNNETSETENLKTNGNLAEQNHEEVKPNPEVQQSSQFVEYIPVAVITIPEGETETQHSMQHQTDQLNSETKSNVEQTQLEEMKTTSQEEYMTTILPIQNETTVSTKEQDVQESTTEAVKTEDTATSSPIPHETTTPAHIVIEETTNALSKFENTLKTLIEQEKLKQQERHLNTLETSQQETTTLAPSSRSLTTDKEEESNTLMNQDETTMLPKKFEEELQMAVKALEETTHHHFEEFQNNLKEAFKKFTVWGTEHERKAEATTLKDSQDGENTTEIVSTQQTLTEQSSTMAKEEETNMDDNVKANTEQSVVNEEPHRIGAINQQFVDKFSDNYEEKSEVVTTDDEKEMQQLSHDADVKEEETTERIFTLTTMPTLQDEEDVKSSHDEQLKEIETSEIVESTTLTNLSEENQTPTAENFVQGSTEEATGTTEQIAETTIVPLLARVPLQKDISSVSLTTLEELSTETNTQMPLTQQHNSADLKETQNELTQTETTQTTEYNPQETITLTSAINSQQEEMVTFVENEDTTTVKPEELPTTQEVEENTATTQTQEPLTQAAFMEEQQQQIESTTEHEQRTQTAADTSVASATTTKNMEDDTTTTQQQQEQTTTEQEIYSTTRVENEDEVERTTDIPTVEPEPRSLNLPPPKLEYLQNEDGVEIFYGYSVVKRN